MSLFKKLLIANRGEIACRIIKTAQRLGIRTVSVFSEADAEALHVKLADEAYCIGPPPSKESYLNITKIIGIAKIARVDAIHPGYGFLSENADFAVACKEAGVIFVGPSVEAIALMANKNVAKNKLQNEQVPMLPDFYAKDASFDQISKAAQDIGYPILLKAAAGGGGKGLRLVRHEKDLEHAFNAVKREAMAFFNDDQILVEKYLENARHIEVQIIADHQGQIAHLSTRDCSVQRRHQKLIEEAPALLPSEEIFDEMVATAKKIASVINYTNAGTIEFLVSENDFYFMEMNTRLQVEHPVTEMITGLDLVEWQLRIASGEPLFYQPTSFKGHAIEVRLNAEDPKNDFLPSSGKLVYLKIPADNQVRIDSGYIEGDQVNIYYDSLIAKIIVWAEDRLAAITLLEQKLKQIEILGIRTNLELLHQCLNNHSFRDGNYDTLFLQKQLTNPSKLVPDEIFCLASIHLATQMSKQNKTVDSHSPWHIHDGWRLFSNSELKFNFSGLKESVLVKVEDNRFTVSFANLSLFCEVVSYKKLDKDIYEIALLINEKFWSAKIFNTGNKIELFNEGHHYRFDLIEDISSRHNVDQDELLVAPMPGTLVAQLVKTGQTVSKGEKLIVIEAMKMEHTLLAPRDGTIKYCHYNVGDLVKEGAQLLEFE